MADPTLTRRLSLLSSVAAACLALGAGQVAAQVPDTVLLVEEPATQDPASNVQFLGTILLDPAFARARDPDGTAADRGNSHYVADAELERARMGDLRDLFAGIASVSVGGGIPIAQKIFVNGVDMLNLAVTLDGVSQNNRVFHHVSANAFDPGILSFARVDAGAAPADAGPHAMAGAVVMETIDADDVIAPGRNFGGTMRLSFDSNSQTFGRSATLAGRMGVAEWLIYHRRATGEDYTTGGGFEVDGSAAALSTTMLEFALALDNGYRLELNAQEMEDNALRPYRANMIDVGRPDPLRLHETLRRSVSLNFGQENGFGLWDPSMVIGYSDITVGVEQPYYPGFSPSMGETSTFSGTFQNTFHLNDLDTITAGLDFYDRRSTFWDPSTPPIIERSRDIGVFAQARIEPSEALSLSFGARYDVQDFTGTTGWQETFQGASGNFSVSYYVTERLRLRGGISSVFGGLTIEDNFIFNPAWDYSTMRASRANNLTLGFDWEDGNIRLDGEVFVTRLDDIRTATYGANALGDAESRGFNLGLGYGWDGGYLRASYAYSQVSVNGSLSDSYGALDLGAPLGGVFALELQHRPQGSDFTFGGSIEAALAYEDVAAGSDNGIPGYAVLNLFAEYEPPSIDGLVIRAEVNNVFDALYADRATYGADYATVTPLYEPGRTFQLTASMRF